jgi:hypothetical protein
MTKSYQKNTTEKHNTTIRAVEIAIEQNELAAIDWLESASKRN